MGAEDPSAEEYKNRCFRVHSFLFDLFCSHLWSETVFRTDCTRQGLVTKQMSDSVPVDSNGTCVAPFPTPLFHWREQ